MSSPLSRVKEILSETEGLPGDGWEAKTYSSNEPAAIVIDFDNFYNFAPRPHRWIDRIPFEELSKQQQVVKYRLNFLHLPKVRDLPSGLGKMMHLSELTIYTCHQLTTLPTSIGKLANLQLLRIDDCHGLTELPQELWNLTQLHLRIFRCPRLVTIPPFHGGDELAQHVRKNTLLIMFCHGLTELPPLPHLRGLEVQDCDKWTNDNNALSHEGYPNLCRLTLGGCPRLTQLPRLPHLGSLKLEGRRPRSFGNLKKFPDELGWIGKLMQGDNDDDWNPSLLPSGSNCWEWKLKRLSLPIDESFYESISEEQEDLLEQVLDAFPLMTHIVGSIGGSGEVSFWDLEIEHAFDKNISLSNAFRKCPSLKASQVPLNLWPLILEEVMKRGKWSDPPENVLYTLLRDQGIYALLGGNQSRRLRRVEKRQTKGRKKRRNGELATSNHKAV